MDTAFLPRAGDVHGPPVSLERRALDRHSAGDAGDDVQVRRVPSGGHDDVCRRDWVDRQYTTVSTVAGLESNQAALAGLSRRLEYERGRMRSQFRIGQAVDQGSFFGYDRLSRLTADTFALVAKDECVWHADKGWVCPAPTPDSTHSYTFDGVGTSRVWSPRRAARARGRTGRGTGWRVGRTVPICTTRMARGCGRTVRRRRTWRTSGTPRGGCCGGCLISTRRSGWTR